MRFFTWPLILIFTCLSLRDAIENSVRISLA